MSDQTTSHPKIFVAGVGPIPPQNPGRLSAPGVRIWGIARELAARGHPVRLGTVEFTGASLDRLYLYDLKTGAEASDLPAPRIAPFGGRTFAQVLADEIDDFGARAAIGSTDLVNRELGELETKIPIWCDFFGDPMAERQMLARLHASDDGLADQWKSLVPALRRADRLSGCSRHQVGALLGELAALGRLNRLTAGEPIVRLVPPWIEPIEPDEDSGPVLRGAVVPEDAFVVIQTGGFNTWLDVETLFESLELAMESHPGLHFAATGGALAGHDEQTFERFKTLSGASTHAERYHLLGWVPLGRTPRIIAEADLGLNVDRPCPEGWLGTRNRILDWIWRLTPVVSTIGCELAEELAAEGHIRGAPQGDPAAIAGAIGSALAARQGSGDRARKAKTYIEKRFSASRSLAPLLEWAKDPKPAPDLHAWRAGEARPSALWLQAGAEADLGAEAESARIEAERLAARLGTLEGSRLVGAALWLRRLLGRR